VQPGILGKTREELETVEREIIRGKKNKNDYGKGKN